ncbi:MAG: SDR family oxidoreductase, partial [Micromonosporaceae bacterium]
MRQLVITGASGYLGRELARQAVEVGWAVVGLFRSAPGDVVGVEWRRADIRERDDIATMLAQTRPDVVIHAASSDHDWATTADGAAHVAVAAANLGARLIHVSSDAIFSGRRAPYDEAAVPDPVTRYGAAKAAAETAARAIAPDAVIARTSLILGDGQSKHERHVRDLVAGRVSGALFTDELRCPVHLGDLASALLELAGVAHGFSGVVNLAGAEALSRHHLGQLIARRFGI